MASRTSPVIVVEDCDNVRHFLVDLLEADGLPVLDYSSSVRAARTKHAPQLLITEVPMGGLNGLELARELRRRFPALPVLFISGDVNPTDQSIDGDGPVAFLAKPFFTDALRDTVRSLLNPTAGAVALS
jgi:two-component system, cell cycle sensor histidine kinase and response regulator CckA